MSDRGKKEFVKAIMTAIYAKVADDGDVFDDEYFQEEVNELTGKMYELGNVDMKDLYQALEYFWNR